MGGPKPPHRVLQGSLLSNTAKYFNLLPLPLYISLLLIVDLELERDYPLLQITAITTIYLGTLTMSSNEIISGELQQFFLLSIFLSLLDVIENLFELHIFKLNSSPCGFFGLNLNIETF